MNTVGEPNSGKPNVRIEGRPGEAVPNRAAYSTLDPALAPTRVFRCHANDQTAYLLWDRRATTRGSTSESRPAAADQFPVPAQDGGRGEQQATDGESAAESCQKQAVGREQVWSLDMAAQDRDLMPEGQQLEIALGHRLSADQEHGHQQSGQIINWREEHEPAR
jgi:hypothetical protein